MKNFKGYSTFTDVKDAKLRAFNRLQTMININENMGEQQAEHYVELFENNDKRDLAIMAAWIKRDGIETVSREVRGEWVY